MFLWWHGTAIKTYTLGYNNIDLHPYGCFRWYVKRKVCGRLHFSSYDYYCCYHRFPTLIRIPVTVVVIIVTSDLHQHLICHEITRLRVKHWPRLARKIHVRACARALVSNYMLQPHVTRRLNPPSHRHRHSWWRHGVGRRRGWGLLHITLTCDCVMMCSSCAVSYGLYRRCWSSFPPLCAHSLQRPAAAGGAQRQQQQQQPQHQRQQHLPFSAENPSIKAVPHLRVVCSQPAGNKSPLVTRERDTDAGAPPWSVSLTQMLR